MVEGSDPQLKGQMIVLSAHSDHVGIEGPPVDHDSLRLANLIARPMGAESPERDLTAAEVARLRTQLDSVRKLRPARPDSISNGADDDASGSMGLLELAEYFQTMPQKPKRSILFVWNVAEEKGLFGSEWFTEHPTVPRDSMIANVNIDMIGRGAAGDIENGGPDYLQLLGSRRLSTEYGDWVEEVNRRAEFAFRLDYQFDAPGHPQQYYCRSDHWHFARWSIPTVFFSTGSHVDYHIVTDEPQYLDYPHYARVVQFVGAFATDVANRPMRPSIDKERPQPHGACRQ
jgi:Zn-dependent M28 family amino/carboxypeptidase